MKLKSAFFCLFLCCWFLPKAVWAVTIQNIRLAPYQPGVVRLVVELSDKTEAAVFRLSNPSRLVIDFKNTFFSKKAPGAISPVGFIKQVRRGVPNPQTARLVLELPPETLEEKHFLLKPSNN
ncbi:MAG: AMIN domain-containing protein, partial [Alphaproteobacteria bacterium]